MKLIDGSNPVALKKQNPMKSHGKLSTREVEKLMGVDRDIYTRKNGALRRK